MPRRLAIVASVAALALLTGCAHTNITGDGTRHERVMVGDVRITGAEHTVTILAGSEVSKLSIMGSDNRVRVCAGGTIEKVEIVGEDNEVLVPEGTVVEYSEIGEDNRLKYLPPERKHHD